MLSEALFLIHVGDSVLWAVWSIRSVWTDPGRQLLMSRPWHIVFCCVDEVFQAAWEVSTPMCISFFFFTCMQPNACYPVMSYSFCLLLSRLSIHFTAPRHSNHATPECWLTPCSLWNSSRDAVSIRGDMIYLLFITLTPRWRLGAAARDVTPAVWCSWRWEQWRKCRTSTGSPGVDKQKHSDRS